MQIQIQLLIPILCSVLVGCTSYERGMGVRDRVVARYEQNFVLTSDTPSEQNWKCTKHVLVDVFTLCFSEFWYSNARSTYQGLMRDEQGWEGFVRDVRGRKWSDVVTHYGPPSRQVPMGDGRTMMVYETKWTFQTGNISGFSTRYGTVVGVVNSSAQESCYQSWLVVDAQNTVTDVRRNWWTLKRANYPWAP